MTDEDKVDYWGEEPPALELHAGLRWKRRRGGSWIPFPANVSDEEHEARTRELVEQSMRAIAELLAAKRASAQADEEGLPGQ